MSKKLQQLEEARSRLREAGLRATPARMALLNHLLAQKGPVSHQEVSDRLETLGVDKSTLFRALQDLVEAGLARRMELGDHVWRFEAIDSKDTKHAKEPHPHLLCVDCGQITCLSGKDIQLHISKSIGMVAEILLRGQCANCL